MFSLTVTLHFECSLSLQTKTHLSSAFCLKRFFFNNILYLKKKFIFNWRMNCFTILCWFLPCINMNQPQVYVCPLPLETPSNQQIFLLWTFHIKKSYVVIYGFFTWQYARILLCCDMYQCFISFYDWIVFHCLDFFVCSLLMCIWIISTF